MQAMQAIGAFVSATPSTSQTSTRRPSAETLADHDTMPAASTGELKTYNETLDAELTGTSKPAAAAAVPVQLVQPSGDCTSDLSSMPGLIVCSQSGSSAATALEEALGAGWELHAPGEILEEEQIARAVALIVILSDGSLDSPAVVFAMRCALAYKKHLPHVLVHAAQTCEFTAVMPRKGTELEDLMPLYYKMRCQITPRHPHSSPTAYMKCAFSLALERDNIALLDERDLVPLRTGLSEKRTYSTVGRSVYA